MGRESDAVSSEALEDIAYLARSDNRVRLLTVLASDSYSPQGLDDVTGIARTTIGRIVTEFEGRGWIERTSNGEYTATPMGQQVAAEFTPLVESFEAIRNLGNLVAWLQAAEPSLSLNHLSDATVIRSGQDDPMKIIDYYIERIQDTSEFYTLNQIAPAGKFMEVTRDRLDGDQLTATFVITGDLADYLLDQPKRRDRWRNCITSGAEVYRVDTTVPCNLLILDETVFIAKTQAEQGEPYTMIESTNDAVRSWAYGIIETYLGDAEPLDAGAFESQTTAEDDKQ